MPTAVILKTWTKQMLITTVLYFHKMLHCQILINIKMISESINISLFKRMETELFHTVVGPLEIMILKS